MKPKAVIILSGGMDSGVLLAKLASLMKTDIYALTFDYGSKHNLREKDYARLLGITYDIKRHEFVNLKFIGETFNSALLLSGEDIPEGHYEDQSMKKTVVPFRNGIMLSLAVGYAESIGADVVYYGAHAGDHAIYPDCREEFVEAFRIAAARGTYNHVQIRAPFSKMTKREIADVGIQIGFDFAKTWTCYKGQLVHCGKCGACTERREALAPRKGFTDPTLYQ